MHYFFQDFTQYKTVKSGLESDFYNLSALGIFLFVEVKMFFDLPTYLTQDEGETSYPLCRQQMLLSVRTDSPQFIS